MDAKVDRPDNQDDETARTNGLWAATLDAASEGMLVTDHRGNIILVNRAYTEITGYRADEVIGMNPRVLRSGRHDEAFYDAMWSALRRDGRWQGEIWNKRRDGEIYPSWLSISSIKDTSGRITNFLGIFADISVIKQAQQQLAYLAHHDPLTGLPNRLMLMERLEHAIELARRAKSQFALMFIDLDDFKKINDSLGHDAGDALLRAVAGRMRDAVRAADTVARLGGDEFVVLLENIKGESEALCVAEKMLESVKASASMQGLSTSASIGIATFPGDGTDVAALMRNADSAMYRSKQAGRNRATAYHASFNASTCHRLELEDALRRALELEQFSLVYQPQYELSSGRITGVEALLRWQHPKLGNIAPAQFVPPAEESGDLSEIGRWVLNTACAEAMSWRRQELFDGRLAVNISIRQLECSEFVQTVKDALAGSGLPAGCLQLEITESVLLRTTGQLTNVLSALHALGVTLAVDDFGSGYSSLYHLKNLPVSTLKIDTAFVQNLPASENDKAIVRAILALGENLDLSIVAEGIENEDQRSLLINEGCRFGQGFHLYRPVTTDQLRVALAR